MFFEDLTPYSYVEGSPPMLNVGWLEQGRPFSNQRPVTESVVLKLRMLAAHPENICRGYHHCDLCDAPPWVHSDRGRSDTWSIPRRGNGEIHVTRDGITYAAPTLLVHYITDHGYSPPQAFVDAVAALNPIELRRRNHEREGRALESFP